MLPFNGRTGTTPRAFIESLNHVITSVWIWLPQSQKWKGWITNYPNDGRHYPVLSSLTNGDLIIVYAPAAVTITYPMPTMQDLLNADTFPLPPRYSSHIYTGLTPASLASMIDNSEYYVTAIVRWNSQLQEWDYFLPRRQPMSYLPYIWFETINPADIIFIYNVMPEPMSMRW